MKDLLIEIEAAYVAIKYCPYLASLRVESWKLRVETRRGETRRQNVSIMGPPLRLITNSVWSIVMRRILRVFRGEATMPFVSHHLM